MKKTVLKVLIVFVFVFAFTTQASADSACPGPVQELTLIGLDGKPAEIGCSDYNALIINLWATWCVPCRVEIPHLVEISAQYKSKKVKVIGISLDARVSRQLKSFIESRKISYPIYLGNTDEVLSKFSVRAVPATLIFDRNGRLYGKLIGLRSKKELRRIIESLL